MQVCSSVPVPLSFIYSTQTQALTRFFCRPTWLCTSRSFETVRSSQTRPKTTPMSSLTTLRVQLTVLNLFLVRPWLSLSASNHKDCTLWLPLTQTQTATVHNCESTYKHTLAGILEAQFNFKSTSADSNVCSATNECVLQLKIPLNEDIDIEGKTLACVRLLPTTTADSLLEFDASITGDAVISNTTTFVDCPVTKLGSYM